MHEKKVGPFLYQINISDGGVPKYPVPEAWISVDGVAGDRQRNRSVHGGKDRAVCLFSLEVIEALRREGHSITAGSAGENLTFAGLDWPHVHPGDQLQIGDTLNIEIMSFCEPCRHNAQWFLDEAYKRISHKIHPGWSRLYARVGVEGLVRRGDPVRVKVAEALRL